MERDYGKVTFEGKEYKLTQDAYADNYEDRVCYYASAEDTDGNTYKIRWETTKAWDEADATYKRLYARQEESKQGVNYAEPLTDEEEDELYQAEVLLQDESDACDWDNPAEIVSTSTRGGYREGAGRKATGRKRRQYYLDDAEDAEVRKLIENLRSDKPRKYA